MPKTSKPTGLAALKAALAEMKADLPKKKGRSKYGAVPVVIGDFHFSSTGEARRWEELKLLLKAGKITSLIRQWKYPLLVNGEVIGSYVSDFVYTLDGVLTVEDWKGFRTPLYRWKKKHFEAQYAPLKITETGKTSRRLTRRKRVSK